MSLPLLPVWHDVDAVLRVDVDDAVVLRCQCGGTADIHRLAPDLSTGCKHLSLVRAAITTEALRLIDWQNDDVLRVVTATVKIRRTAGGLIYCSCLPTGAKRWVLKRCFHLEQYASSVQLPLQDPPVAEFNFWRRKPWPTEPVTPPVIVDLVEPEDTSAIRLPSGRRIVVPED